jgi:5-methylcytosine-specific restriction protein A
MTIKDDLRPTGRNRVIDLVSASGVDVADWANFGRGAKWAAANPKYCYDWAFLEPGKLLVLNLWHAHIRETGGAISVALNMRKDSAALAAKGGKTLWVRRAATVDQLIQVAVKEQLPVRAIINDGTMRDSMEPQAKASKVERRFLDPMPWSITSYDISTGQCVVRRGGKSLISVDQFDIPELASILPERVDKTGKVYVRNPAVRHAALARANGRCEYCDVPGFALPNGAFFLETHHIIPLSDGGADHVTNVAGLCPNHHREAHYGAAAKVIRDYLRSVAA